MGVKVLSTCINCNLLVNVCMLPFFYRIKDGGHMKYVLEKEFTSITWKVRMSTRQLTCVHVSFILFIDFGSNLLILSSTCINYYIFIKKYHLFIFLTPFLEKEGDIIMSQDYRNVCKAKDFSL